VSAPSDLHPFFSAGGGEMIGVGVTNSSPCAGDYYLAVSFIDQANCCTEI